MKKATIYDYARMCRTVITCDNCPMCATLTGIHLSCDDLLIKNPDKANEIILNWCKEHPVETRQDRFLKMFPNAKVTSDCLDICPQDIDKTYTCRFHPDTCDKCKRKYWLAEVNEK